MPHLMRLNVDFKLSVFLQRKHERHGIFFSFVILSEVEESRFLMPWLVTHQSIDKSYREFGEQPNIDLIYINPFPKQLSKNNLIFHLFL